MKAYSENVANAADVITSESDKQAELDAKAAIVAQAEAANSAAIDGTSSSLAIKSLPISQNEMNLEKQKKQAALQFQADK